MRDIDICVAKQTKIEAPYNHICDFSRGILNVCLCALTFNTCSEVTDMVIGGFYFLILADHRMTIYLPEGCALAGSENLFIFGEIWGSIGRLRLTVELVFEGLTFCFQCQCCRI